jgi:hypothetical protein
MQVPGPPSGFGAYEKPVAQSVDTVQLVLQAALTQAKGVQSVTEVGVQWWAASQVAAASRLGAEDWHPAGAQEVPMA